MSKQIDWSKAPEGATHYFPPTEVWYMAGNGCAPLVWTGMWRKAFQFSQREHKCVQRPTTPSWSGEGLPPVGVVCEMHYCGEWEKTEILCIGVKHVFIRQIAVTGEAFECSLNLSACQFRPIRTPEKIEADQREAQIVAIHDAIVTSVKVTLGQCDSWRKVAEMVYDAGFKRPE